MAECALLILPAMLHHNPEAPLKCRRLVLQVPNFLGGGGVIRDDNVSPEVRTLPLAAGPASIACRLTMVRASIIDACDCHVQLRGVMLYHCGYAD